MARRCQAPGGPGNRPQPHGQRQTRLQAAHRRRRAGHSAGGAGQRSEPARFDDVREMHRRAAGHQGTAGQAAPQAIQAACRQGYDYACWRAYLKKRGIASRIARRGVESRERLGRHRWVVERTHGWFAGFGKLRIRFERRLDIHEALLKLAEAIICARFVDRWC